MRNLFIFVVVLLAAACTRDYDTTVVIDSEDCVTSSYSLKEQAKQSVQEMLNKLDPPTRGFARTVASVEVITYGELFGEDARTRTDSTALRPIVRYYNPALLLANFTNNSGCAVLHPLFDEDDNVANEEENTTTAFEYLAITDSGALTSNEIITYANSSSADYIPPVNLYATSSNDFYTGNTDANELLASLVVSYVYQKANNPEYSNLTYEDHENYARTESVATSEFGPLLKTTWDQGAPFNYYVHVYDDQGHKRPLGCTTIAAGQIITYLKDKSLSTYFGIDSLEWEDLENEDFSKNMGTYNNMNETIFSIAHMLDVLADGIGVRYNYFGSGGTFALPVHVERFLENYLGYSIDRQVGGRKFKRLRNIVNSLNNNKPVFMAGLGDCRYGHAWVVDGYMRNPQSNKEVRDYLIHCNFGWGGSNNGWYLIDTITSNLNDDDLLDEGVTEEDMRFNWAFRYLFFE